jgi:hypothetical protein
MSYFGCKRQKLTLLQKTHYLEQEAKIGDLYFGVSKAQVDAAHFLWSSSSDKDDQISLTPTGKNNGNRGEGNLLVKTYFSLLCRKREGNKVQAKLFSLYVVSH